MKKIFILSLLFVCFGILAKAFANVDNCRVLYNDGKYYSAANCYYQKVQNYPDDPFVRFWYAASLFHDRQLSEALYQYEYIANNYAGTNVGSYASTEAQKVKKKIQHVRNAKMNDVGNYLNDLQKTFAWEKQPIRVWIQPSKYDNTVRKAFQEWQTRTQGVVKFNYYPMRNDAYLRVYLVDELTCSGVHNALACTTISTRGGKWLSNARIEILQKTKSGQMCSDRQLYNVVLHEIGHALGIYGHSKNSNDIMYEQNSSYDVHLSQKDINTIRAIYRK